MPKKATAEEKIIESVDDLDLDLGDVETTEESSSLDEVPDSLNLEDSTPEVPPTDPIAEENPAEKSTEIPLEASEVSPKDIDIDLDIDEAPVTQVKKSESSPKKTKKTDVQILDPEFHIEKIETDEKYQVRIAKIKNVEELADIIKLQGQIEPIRIVQDGDKYFMMAGFRRLAAMKLLGKKHVKAIIHQNLDHDEIMKISSGTNLGRDNLSDADKIFSVIRFQNQNKVRTPREIGKVFGLSEATAYRYLNIGVFLNKHKKLSDELADKGYPYNVFDSVYRTLKDDLEIPEEKICNYLATKFELGGTGKKEFEIDFSAFVSDVRVKAKIKSEEDEIGAALDDTDATPAQIANAADTILKEKGKKATEEDSASIASRKAVVDQLDSMLQCFSLMEDYVNQIQKTPDFKKFIDTKKITKIQGAMAKFNVSVGKLV